MRNIHDQIAIKTLETTNVEELAKIHINSLPNDVLPNLGFSFLCSYYTEIERDREQILVGCYYDKEIIGFCHISCKEINYFKVSKLIFYYSILRLILFKPKIFALAILQFWKRRELAPDTAEISFVGLLPEYQGLGIGEKIIRYCLDVSLRCGFKFLRTKTSNVWLKEFYEKRFKARKVDTLSGIDTVYYYLNLPTKVG